MFGDEKGIYLLAYDPGRMRAYPVGPRSVRRLILTLDRALNNSVEITTRCWASRSQKIRAPALPDQYATFCGRLAKVTWTFMGCEPLRIFKVIC